MGIALALGVASVASAQNLRQRADRFEHAWRWTRFTTQHGLPSDDVRDVIAVRSTAPGARDRHDGTTVAWALTRAGLTRFDGYQWLAATPESGLPQDVPTAIRHAGRSAILVDYTAPAARCFVRLHGRFCELPARPRGAAFHPSDGLLCLLPPTSENRLCRFTGDRFEPLALPEGATLTDRAELWPDAQAGAILTDQHGTWLFARGRWQPVTGLPTGERIVAHRSQDRLRLSIAAAADGPRRLVIWDEEQIGSVHIESPPPPMDYAPVDIGLGRDGLALVRFADGSTALRSPVGRWHRLKAQKELRTERHFAFGRDGRLWIATPNGVVLFDHGSDRWQTLASTPAERFRGASAALLLNRRGTLWAAVGSRILAIAANGTVEQRSVALQEGVMLTPNSLAESAAGKIYAGADSGVYEHSERWRRFGAADGLKLPIAFVASTADGKILAFPESGGVRRLEGHQFLDHSAQLRATKVLAFAAGRGAEWYATTSGLIRLRGTERTDFLAETSGATPVDQLHFAGNYLWLRRGNRAGYIDAADVVHWLPNSETPPAQRCVIAAQPGLERPTLWVATTQHIRRHDGTPPLQIGAGTGVPAGTLAMLATERLLYLALDDGSVVSFDQRTLQSHPTRIVFRNAPVQAGQVTLGWDAFAAFGDQPKGEIFTQYRIDRGPWSDWAHDRETRLDLPFGNHLVEVRARNRFHHVGPEHSMQFEMPYTALRDPNVLIPVGIMLLLLLGGSTVAFARSRRHRHRFSIEDRKYRDLLEHAKDVVFSLSGDHRIADISPSIERIRAQPREFFVGRSVAELAIEAADRDALLQCVERVAAGEAASSLQITVRGHDGEPRTLELRLWSVAGQPRIQGIARDITMRLQLEHTRSRAERLAEISKLSSGVAHDFNNLLTIIRGHSENVLMEPESLDPDSRTSMKNILRATRRAELLTLRLMAQSRRETLNDAVTDVVEVLQSAVHTIGPLLPAEISMELRLLDGEALVRVDPHGLEQIILNLCFNARDAMPNGGDLCVSCTDERLPEELSVGTTRVPPGRYVTVRVSDTGEGMDPDTQMRVFEPFFTTKGPSQGTGLGLATVQSTVARSSGFVTVESRLGYGTTFTVYLPWTDEIPRTEK